MAWCDDVRSRDDLVASIRTLRKRIAAEPHRFENTTLDDYLEALAAWIADMDGWSRNHGEVMPDDATWRHVARMLTAAAHYE